MVCEKLRSEPLGPGMCLDLREVMWRTTCFRHVSGQPPGLKTLIADGPMVWRQRFLDTCLLNIGAAFFQGLRWIHFGSADSKGSTVAFRTTMFERGVPQKGLLPRSNDEANREPN